MVVAASPTDLPEALRLSDVGVGTLARLHAVRLDREAHDALRGLGLTDTSTLRVCKQGEPCVVQVHATRIGLSQRVAREIFVHPETPGASAAR